MQQKTKQLIMTLVALLALTTHAWAKDPTVYNSGDVSLAQLEQGDILMPGVTLTNVNNSVTPYLVSERYSIGGTIYENGSRISSFPFSIGENGLISAQLGGGSNPTSNCMPITEDGKTGNAWVVVNKTTSYDGTSIRIGGTIYPKPTPFAITWSAATPNTASIDKMPAGNVTVSVDYFAQAELAESGAPAAIANVPANTDEPIVTPGTVANIGTSEVKQGTLMYFVSQTTGETAPEAPDYDTDGWSEDVPTANGLAQGKAYVWYYIKGAEPDQVTDRTDDNTRSDSDIKPLGTTGFVTLDAEPTYDVTLNDEGLSTDEAAAWKVAKGTDDPAAFPLEGVKKSETVTVTYTGTKKIIGVKAEKEAATPAIDYSTAQLGDLFYSDGTFSTTLEDGKTPIGVIAYLDQEGTDDDGITEKSNGAGHGLVLCLKNAASGADAKWSTEKVSKFPGQEVTSVADLKRTENVSGYTNTATLTVDATTAEKYPAAKAAKEYTTLAAPTGTTGWFLPSAQQWVKMIEGLGGLSDGAPYFAESWFDNSHTAADKWEAALSKAGNGNYDSMTSELFYSSSSESSADKAVTLGVDATDTGFNYGFLWNKDSKDDSIYGMVRVRPVLAF